MYDTDNKGEHWTDAESDSLWARSPATKVFSLVSVRGKQVDERWGVVDFAKALNCGVSNSPDDGSLPSGSVAFPPGFKYSPNTGKPIVKPVSKVRTWLPINGSDNLKSGLLRGGCLTAYPLKLKGDSLLSRDPDRELPLPGLGHFRFCVGAFGLSASFLLALNAEQGTIYCLLPSRNEWAELTPTPESTYLGSESFSARTWNIEAQELAGDSILFWPSDHGLVGIKIDVLALSYDAKLLAEGCCVSVPRIVRNKVYVLIEKPDGVVRAISVDADWRSENQPCELEIAGIPAAKWIVAAATPSEVIWLSEAGQVVLRPNANQYLYIPWEAGGEPQFLLGGPHCSSDGRLWMQVLHPIVHEGEKGFCFIQLGRPNPDQRPSFGARMLTGKSSIKVEKLLRNDPWIEPTVVANMDYDNDEAVVPVLESLQDGTLFVIRADHLQGITRFFERTDELIVTRFQIMGLHTDKGFYVKRLREPWITSAFVFEDMLFIYHPDIGMLPGWVTVSANGE